MDIEDWHGACSQRKAMLGQSDMAVTSKASQKMPGRLMRDATAWRAVRRRRSSGWARDSLKRGRSLGKKSATNPQLGHATPASCSKVDGVQRQDGVECRTV